MTYTNPGDPNQQPGQYPAAPQSGVPAGYVPAPPMYGGYPQPQQGNGIATAGMVCGIVGFVLFWVPFLGIVLGLLGIIFGGVGISKANKGASGKGMAIAGLVLGVVTIVIYIIVVVAVVNTRTF